MKNDLPCVYVLVPAYNAEKFINKSLNSVLEQTYTKIKCVICNDYSSDKTTKIINEYGLNHPSIFSLIHNTKKKGLSSARNTLQEYTKANAKQNDLIINLDADDRIISRTFIAAFVSQMLKTNADICLWGIKMIYEDKSAKKNAVLTLKEITPSKNIINKICLEPGGFCRTNKIKNLYRFTSLGWTKGYKADVFNALPQAIPGIKFEDFVYVAGLFNSQTITALPWEKYGYEYLKRGTSITGTRKPQDMNDVLVHLQLLWNSTTKNKEICHKFIKMKIKDYETITSSLK